MPKLPQSFNLDKWDDTLLRIDPEEVPKVLQIGCSHPRRGDTTALGSPARRYWCFNPKCNVEWYDIERF